MNYISNTTTVLAGESRNTMLITNYFPHVECEGCFVCRFASPSLQTAWPVWPMSMHKTGPKMITVTIYPDDPHVQLTDEHRRTMELEYCEPGQCHIMSMDDL